jgi:two-component system response regulator HydG
LTRSVLIVDDDERICSSLSRVLARDGAHVSVASNARVALSQMDETTPDLVICDVRMPGMDGLELLRLLKERAPRVDVVMMTAFDDLPTVSTAMRDGAIDLMVKPLDLHQLRQLVDRIFDDRQNRPEMESPRVVTPEGPVRLVGHAPKMIEVFKRIGRAAATDATVLIRGESGTGKELVARAIHEASRRSDEPFVAVDCTAIPENLIESELFGHVKGAFTGAERRHRGRFAEAGSGTIFLDEIGDTSAPFQAKLLRVLQEKEVRPVGADRSEPTAARVLAATHRDLESRVEEGRFREDLYYRLRIVEIELPPLRERLEDVPELAEFLIARAAAATDRPAPALGDDAREALLSHDWPGNVRELENCLARAVVLTPGDLLRRDDLHLNVKESSSTGLSTLEEVGREHVLKVLTATGGNKTRAAEILGISRPRLRRLLARDHQDE